MKIKVLKKSKINNSLKIEICKLKKTFWNYTLKSHIEWFENNIKKEVLYLSRSNIPFEFKSINKFISKHLSIISFKPDSLKKFSESKKTPLEKIEDIELLRALEIGLKIKTFNLKGDSFSVDVLDDYKKAKKQMVLDKFFKLYKI
jgi:3-deoxy-manno-octulosonate cytidylyltransferase (CMP-KDO synthetase)